MPIEVPIKSLKNPSLQENNKDSSMLLLKDKVGTWPTCYLVKENLLKDLILSTFP